MKNILLIAFLLLPIRYGLAQVGIGTTTPDESSILHVQSSNRGFLPPIVSLTSTNDVSTINSPAEGLMIYSPSSNTNLPSGIYVFDGNQWTQLLTVVPQETRLIKDVIGVNSVTFSDYDSFNNYGNYTTLFNDSDDTGGSSFHSTRSGSPSGDWGFGINLPQAYTINKIILDGRNDCCTARIENVVIKLYNAGFLVYTTTPISNATTGDNQINIQNISADEIRFVVENGGSTSGGAVINFSELKVYGN